MSAPLETLRSGLAALTASEAAELFLSPHVDPRLLREATAEEGPALWIVNRSDVYDETLEAMTTHPWAEMAARAREKLHLRRGESLRLLQPFELEGPIEEVPDFAVEDLLGHPLAPFEAMLFFSKSLSEDIRASSALSLTRRVLEHPPNWDFDPQTKARLVERFSYNLIEDPSPYVRAYTARIPILPEAVIEQAYTRERESYVRGRLLQNPSVPAAILELAVSRELERAPASAEPASPFEGRILSLDRRVPSSARVALAESATDALSRAAHLWYLEDA